MKVFSLIVCMAAVLTQAQGDSAFAAGDFTTALAAYRQTLTADPNSFPANFGAAQIALYENNVQDAARYLNAAQRLSNPSQVPQIARLVGEVEARFRAQHAADALHLPPQGVSVPMAAVDPLPLFSVQVDGRQVYFLLDTGAPNFVIDPDFAKELGLWVQGGQLGTFAGGRRATVRNTTIPTFRIGSLTLHKIAAGVLPTRPLPFFGSKRVDGVIGTIFLSQFLSTVDYPHAQLILRPRSNSAAFERSLGASAVAIPFWYVPDHFLLARGSVNALDNQLLLIDSGLAGGGFMPSQETVGAANIGLDQARAGQGIGGGGAVLVIPFTLDRLCLASVCQADIPGRYTPQGGPFGIFPFKVAGIVSHEFLKHYAWSIDFDAMRMVLQGP